MSNIAAIRQTKADPLRVALKKALAAQAEAADAVERVQQGIRATRAAVFAAKRDLEKAKAAIGEVMEDAAAEIAAAATAGEDVPVSTAVSRARETSRDHEDRIATLEAALVKLKADHALCQQAAEAAAVDVQVAVDAILAERARPLLERAQQLRDELTPIVDALAGLWRASANDRGPRGEAFEAVGRDAALLFGWLRHLGTSWETAADGSSWQAARAALLTDPDADLEPHLKRNADGAGTS